ncbi:hypothetical protein CEQ90_13105 [Lewinellaceae bacterium SD302]|nr:hypothetical protein CEQ90_13105 [Lewinellaceae bacterium SD302]
MRKDIDYPPQRILIIGCCGAGKSTFARKLAERTDLPIIHLDQEYWKPDWVETPKEEWAVKIKALAARDRWIMDGNYSGSMSVRIPRADVVFYLDYPTAKCLWRVVKRVSRYHGRNRPDMPPGCNERFDWGFFHYVATFNLTRKKLILQQLDRLGPAQKLHVFKNDTDAERYLNSLN